MSILVDKNSKALIQGITGKEGRRAVAQMLSYSTKVLAGVTPGKGGENVLGVPVYNSVKEAMYNHPDINISFIAVPALAVKDAAIEAISESIPIINVFAEHVPTQDSAMIFALAQRKNLILIGPSSVGIISPGKAKVGGIGNESMPNVFTRGQIGIVSKSGGMTSEIALTLSNAGFGQSTALGIGGDKIIGFDFVDALKLFEKDDETKVVIMFCEIGGTYEEQVAEFIINGGFKKKVIALVAGKFTEQFPQGTVLGHAGAIVERGKGGYESKVSALRSAGVIIAENLDQIPSLLA